MNGAPERIRTSDRSVRSRVLYPAELRVRDKVNGGERGIRTLDRAFEPYTPLAGERLQPARPSHHSLCLCAVHITRFKKYVKRFSEKNLEFVYTCLLNRRNVYFLGILKQKR